MEHTIKILFYPLRTRPDFIRKRRPHWRTSGASIVLSSDEMRGSALADPRLEEILEGRAGEARLLGRLDHHPGG